MGTRARPGTNGKLDRGNRSAARLLAGLLHNAAPSLDAFWNGALQSLLAAFGDHGNEARDAGFGALLQRPLEMVELHQREQQRNGRHLGRVRQLLDHGEQHTALVCLHNFGQIHALVVGDFELLPALHAKHAHQMMRLVALHRRTLVANLLDEEAAACHVQ